MTTPPERGIEEIRQKLNKVYLRLAYGKSDIETAKKEVDEILHQELQQARHDWLREEIVKLEGMKQPITLKDRVESAFASIEWDRYNQALQTIIYRYQSELDQPK